MRLGNFTSGDVVHWNERSLSKNEQGKAQTGPIRMVQTSFVGSLHTAAGNCQVVCLNIQPTPVKPVQSGPHITSKRGEVHLAYNEPHSRT